MSGQEPTTLGGLRDALSPYLNTDALAALDAVLDGAEEDDARVHLEREARDMHDAIKEAFMLLSRSDEPGSREASLNHKAALDVLRPFAQRTDPLRHPSDAHRRHFG